MLDRLTGFRVFSRVAALGSLSAAARVLGMSQTMATKHIAAIEEKLGTKLLHRTTRRLTLTEAGRTYLESVERILADLDEADAAASAVTFEVRGTLRVNVPVSFGIREIAPTIPEFTERNPAIAIELGLNDRRVDLIEEGWDLVVRIGSMTDSTMIARRLTGCRTVVCAAPSYLAARGLPQKVDQLAGHNCLGYTLSQQLGVRQWRFGRRADVQVAVGGNLQANNGDVLVAAAIAGQGVVYQPAFLVYREIAAGLLVELALDHETVPLDGIYAGYPATRTPPAKVRAFIDHLARRFADPPWE